MSSDDQWQIVSPAPRSRENAAVPEPVVPPLQPLVPRRRGFTAFDVVMPGK